MRHAPTDARRSVRVLVTVLAGLLTGVLAAAAPPARAELSFVWEGHFSEAEKAKLTA